MWLLRYVPADFHLWFSDGRDVHALRGLPGSDSSRLIVNGVGFLDLTEVSGQAVPMLDANDSLLFLRQSSGVAPSKTENEAHILSLDISLQEPDTFTLSLVEPETSAPGMNFVVLHNLYTTEYVQIAIFRQSASPEGSSHFQKYIPATSTL